MPNTNDIDGGLTNWNDLKDYDDWSGLLIGNGASIAVWDKFRYASIYEMAKSDEINDPLSEADIHLFETLRTTNFEQILSSLSTTKIINNALGIDTQIVENRYNSIKTGLIQAVKAVHVPWRIAPITILSSIREELLNYKYVYSTNYDLLIYWAIMHGNGKGFKDFFWDEPFDIGNTKVWDKVTCVLYLHGGLHLYHLPSGQALKRRANSGLNLLDLFGQNYYLDAVPLFISEGTSEEKLNSIYRSDYLSFAFSQFSEHEGPLVIFRHSLSENDKHIVSTIAKWKHVRIAISMVPNEEAVIRSKKAKIISDLPEAELFFFDATTHPLGSQTLNIPVE